jgi:hypothetical protein
MPSGDAPETLTDLVAAVLQPRGADTLDTLTPRCVDPVSGYAPSRNTVWKLSRADLAEGVKINPKVVAAMAAGVGVPTERAQRAAAYQFTGYLATVTDGGTVVHDAQVDAGDIPKSRAIMEGWAEEESPVQRNPTEPS